ncbi:LysM peptidoglycan-binding domain-containing protein, partial [Arthrospira platensis SPKY1]|nr:LysM peptidoglycan-binding domain-containing protein [Arthrospira platensis SPKY1]
DFNQRERPNEQLSTAWATSSVKIHTVRRGENLGLIARKYGLSVNELKRINNLKSNNIGIGKKLKVGTEAQTAFGSSPKSKPTQKNQAFVVANPTKTEQVAVNTEKTSFHKVESGETLNHIAQKYNVSVDDLKLWNNLQ